MRLRKERRKNEWKKKKHRTKTTNFRFVRSEKYKKTKPSTTAVFEFGSFRLVVLHRILYGFFEVSSMRDERFVCVCTAVVCVHGTRFQKRNSTELRRVPHLFWIILDIPLVCHCFPSHWLLLFWSWNWKSITKCRSIGFGINWLSIRFWVSGGSHASWVSSAISLIVIGLTEIWAKWKLSWSKHMKFLASVEEKNFVKESFEIKQLNRTMGPSSGHRSIVCRKYRKQVSRWSWKPKNKNSKSGEPLARKPQRSQALLKTIWS